MNVLQDRDCPAAGVHLCVRRYAREAQNLELAKEAHLSFYTIEATGAEGVFRLKSPLTAAQAYARTVELRRRGFTEIAAINITSGRRITDVKRLLRDL